MNNKCINNGCPLYEKGIKPLKLEKNNSEILLIFQAPGKIEWTKKAPIQKQESKSSAGWRIAKSWLRTGRKREEFDITNIVLCYPGFNEKIKRDKKPNKKTINCCLEKLKKEIENNKYTKIICFGKIARENICKIFPENIKNLQIKTVRHPCGGLSNEELDSLWAN